MKEDLPEHEKMKKKEYEGKKEVEDIDDIFAITGEFGKYQLLIIVLVGLIASAAAISSYLTIFTDATPKFRCKLPMLANDTYKITSDYQKGLVERYIPESNDDRNCKIKEYDYPIIQNSTYTLVSCESWVYSKEFYDETLVTKFNYVCDREEEKGIYKTLLFAGQFGVMIIGLLADRFGRKNIAYLFLVLNGLIAVLFAIVVNINLNESTFKILFGSLRLFVGCTSNIFSLGVVFAVEIVGPSYRVLAANTIYYFFIFGEFITLLLAYFLRDYKDFFFYSAFVISSVALYFWFIPESPRYLILKKRYKEVDAVFRRIAKSNNQVYDGQINFDALTQSHEEKPNAMSSLKNNNASSQIKRRLSLFKNRKFFLMFLASLVNWFTCSFVYNGLSYNIDVLGGNPYLNFFFSSCAELAGVSSSQYLLRRFGRKIPYASNMMLVFVSLAVIGIVPEDSNAILIVCVLVGKFAVSFTFNAIYVITSESYPTEIRNTAVSFLTSFARFGGTFSAYVQISGGRIWKPLPYVIYGCMALISATLFVLLVPETKGKRMPETIEDMLDE